jgi:hypothetical protein
VNLQNARCNNKDNVSFSVHMNLPLVAPSLQFVLTHNTALTIISLVIMLYDMRLSILFLRKSVFDIYASGRSEKILKFKFKTNSMLQCSRCEGMLR